MATLGIDTATVDRGARLKVLDRDHELRLQALHKNTIATLALDRDEAVTVLPTLLAFIRRECLVPAATCLCIPYKEAP